MVCKEILIWGAYELLILYGSSAKNVRVPLDYGVELFSGLRYYINGDCMGDLKIDFDSIRLIEPCAEYMESFRSSFREYRLKRVEDFSYPRVNSRREQRAFLRRTKDNRLGRNMPSGRVPHSNFWLVDKYNYLGSGDIRHFLTDSLRKLGGNIGYSIRPAAWGQGLGTMQLALLLPEAKKLNIPAPIITCFEHNIASAKVIEKNGGILIEKTYNRYNGVDLLTRIYRINL